MRFRGRFYRHLLHSGNARGDAAVLLVEHDPSLLARICARVTVLNRRVVSAGDPGRLSEPDLAAEASAP